MRTKFALIGGAMVLVLLVLMAQPVPVVRVLRDLQDVKPSVPPSNGDALIFNTASGKWTNGPAGGSGDVTNTYNTIIVTNLYVQNGGHNTMIITNSLTIQPVKTNLLATTATGLVTNANYGTGIAWDPVTRTISATAVSGDTTGTNIITLTQTGTNLDAQLNFASLQFGGAWKIVLTQSVYIGAPSGVATSPFRKAWLLVQQPSTGTCYVNFTNGWFAGSEGAHPVNDTNNGSVTIYEFITDPFSNLVHVAMTAKSKLFTNSIP
jgi:hypothetical protein